MSCLIQWSANILSKFHQRNTCQWVLLDEAKSEHHLKRKLLSYFWETLRLCPLHQRGDPQGCYQRSVQKPASLMLWGRISASDISSLHNWKGINAEKLIGFRTYASILTMPVTGKALQISSRQFTNCIHYNNMALLQTSPTWLCSPKLSSVEKRKKSRKDDPGPTFPSKTPNNSSLQLSLQTVGLYIQSGKTS